MQGGHMGQMAWLGAHPSDSVPLSFGLPCCGCVCCVLCCVQCRVCVSRRAQLSSARVEVWRCTAAPVVSCGTTDVPVQEVHTGAPPRANTNTNTGKEAVHTLGGLP